VPGRYQGGAHVEVDILKKEGGGSRGEQGREGGKCCGGERASVEGGVGLFGVSAGKIQGGAHAEIDILGGHEEGLGG
jgi:hypothetical protein